MTPPTHTLLVAQGIDDANGVPGTLYARFAGDTYGYDGAGPWILVTAGFAENAYRGASEVVARNALPSPEALAHYAKIFAADPSDLAAMSPPEFALKVRVLFGAQERWGGRERWRALSRTLRWQRIWRSIVSNSLPPPPFSSLAPFRRVNAFAFSWGRWAMASWTASTTTLRRTSSG